jgi:hypothetical protein
MAFGIAHMTDTHLSQVKALSLDNHGDLPAIKARMDAQQDAAQ